MGRSHRERYGYGWARAARGSRPSQKPHHTDCRTSCHGIHGQSEGNRVSALERLRELRRLEKAPTQPLTELTKGASVSFVSAQLPRIPKLSEATENLSDDRRHCRSCRNLSRDRGCSAARRGELSGVAVDAKPIDTIPRRCVGYLPLRTDPDQRSGRERWPSMLRPLEVCNDTQT